MSPCGLPLAGLMLGTEASTPAGHRLLLCLSPTAWQFRVPRAAIRAGGRRDEGPGGIRDAAQALADFFMVRQGRISESLQTEAD
jgi:hypothetical protein